MAPKLKYMKQEWAKCEICLFYFPAKDISSHDSVCQISNPFDFENTEISFGCSKNQYVIGPVHIITKTGQADIPKSWLDGLVYIHPQTLKFLNLSIGGEAILQHINQVIVWPDTTIPLDCIGMCEFLAKKLFLKKGHAVILHQLTKNTTNASSIYLYSEFNIELGQEKDLSAYLEQFLEGKTLTAGNRIITSFYGKPINFIVSRIIGENKEERTLQQNINILPRSNDMTLDESIQNVSDVSSSDLAQSLFELSLNDSSISTSSPLKDTMKGKQKDDYHLDKSSLNGMHTKQDVNFFIVNRDTKLFFETKDMFDANSSIGDESLMKRQKKINRIGGYSEQIKKLKEMFDNMFTYSIQQKINFTVSKGVLLYGPSGCGKTYIAKGLTELYKLHTVSISGPDIWSKFYGESETKLRSLFKEAKIQSPSVILLDEIDTICPKRETLQGDVEKRVVSSLLSLIDDIVSCEEEVLLVATSSKRDRIDPAVRRPGRLDREIEIGVPTASDRTQIVTVLLQDVKHSVKMEDIEEVARGAHGYVTADILALVKESGLHALRRCQNTEVTINKEDLLFGLQTIQPSAMREVAIEVPNVRWEDIGGQSDLKHKLKQAIEWPLKHPEAFVRLGIRPPKGLLMYGPPGCSKTMIAKALAKESGINFIAIKGPELFSKWVGESERAVRETFRKARSAAPAIIFFDEIDALAGERGSSSGGGGDVSDRVLAQLLTEIDGVEALQDVTIVAATNRPDRIDKALMRPGRLDRIVYVPLPDANTRRDIFKIQFRHMPTAEDVNADELVEKTHRYSGAEVSAVCHEAALCAMQEDINISRVHRRHFTAALTQVVPRITDELLEFYDKYAGISGLHSI